jgi:hypothetical protein
VCAGLGLPGFADRSLPLDTWWKRFDFLSETMGLFGKALFKGRGLLDMASLHGAAPSRGGGSALVAFSSPMKAKGRAVMPGVCHVRYRTHGQFCSPLKS